MSVDQGEGDWESVVEELDRRTRRHRLIRRGEGRGEAGPEPLTRSRVFRSWRDDGEFRVFFREVLHGVPFEAFLWETPPVRRSTLEESFEFVVVDCPPLAGVQPDPRAFDEHFRRAANPSVVSFSSLGGDAGLVAPCPADAPRSAHLADFVRTASSRVWDELWQEVGAAVERRLGDAPLWLSTSGLGVSWLHVRLDERPKYYAHDPYRAARVT